MDHPLPRLVIALPDALGQTHLILGGDAVELADFKKINLLRSVLGGVPVHLRRIVPGLSVRVGVSVPKFGITTWGERGTVASGD